LRLKACYGLKIQKRKNYKKGKKGWILGGEKNKRENEKKKKSFWGNASTL